MRLSGSFVKYIIAFDNDDIHWVIAIKSGPNWGNSSQIKKMKDDFDEAKRRFHSSNHKGQIRCINGCCYGLDRNPYKSGDYWKYCGQKFWEFISGSPTLYAELIDALGHKAQESSELFDIGYVQTRARLFDELAGLGIVHEDGTINWRALAEISAKPAPRKRKKTAITQEEAAKIGLRLD